MSRHVPTVEEQAAIDLLALSGFKVTRLRSYDALRRRVDIAEAQRTWVEEELAHSRRRSEADSKEYRRLSDRLTFVYGAAIAAGATHEDLRGPS